MELVREGRGRMLLSVLLQETVWEHSSLLGSERKAPYALLSQSWHWPELQGEETFSGRQSTPNDRRWTRILYRLLGDQQKNGLYGAMKTQEKDIWASRGEEETGMYWTDSGKEEWEQWVGWIKQKAALWSHPSFWQVAALHHRQAWVGRRTWNPEQNHPVWH